MPAAVGYARVSTDEQRKENNSIPVQNRKIAGYCAENGIDLLKVFEESESARTMERPQLLAMIDFCRKSRGKVTTLVVSDLSRLARNVTDQALIVMQLSGVGVKLVSVDEPLTDDSATGQFLRNMLGSVNQLFSDALAERTRERMKAQVKQGRFLWSAPLGYVNKDRQLLRDPDRAPLVAEAFALVASGRYPTTDAVLKVITAMGLTTRKGKKVTKQTFARMLSNPVYAGWVVSGDVRVRGQHEAIITDELFDAVQERINSKSAPHKALNEDFPLRGVVRCAACNRGLTAGWVQGRKKKKYPRYWCWTKDCRAVGIARDELEQHLVRLLALMKPTAEFLAMLPDLIAHRWQERKQKIASDASRLLARLDEQKTLNQRAVRAKVNGEISQADYDGLKDEIAAETERINAQIKALDSERDTMDELMRQARIEAVDLVGAWNKGNINQRREIVSGFFPDGLVFSHEKGFIEPANTVLMDMFMRSLEEIDLIGVPDGI